VRDVLKTLTIEARQLADPEFLMNVRPGHPALDGYDAALEADIDLTSLDSALQPFRDRDLRSEDDGPMAVAIHDTLPLTRSLASQPGPWWWLCVCRYPDIVRRRWADAIGLSADRMFGSGTRLTRNALARLWWGAEMTHETTDPDRYAQMLFANQDVYEALVGRSIGNHPLAVETILDVVEGENGKLAREAVKRFRHLLSTLVLEGMTKEQIRAEMVACLERQRRQVPAEAT
jgi:hypothetical protein